VTAVPTSVGRADVGGWWPWQTKSPLTSLSRAVFWRRCGLPIGDRGTESISGGAILPELSTAVNKYEVPSSLSSIRGLTVPAVAGQLERGVRRRRAQHDGCLTRLQLAFALAAFASSAERVFCHR
jgi:hypothetical protein